MDCIGIVLLLLWSIVPFLLHVFWLKPCFLRLKFRKQGITGPFPSLVLGNLPEIKKTLSKASLSSAPSCSKDALVEDPAYRLFPYFKLWAKQYDLEVVREINIFKSLDLGKPMYLQKDRGPLLGKGIITTSGAVWYHQRKTLGPQLYMDKIKGNLDLFTESANMIVNSWENIIEENSGAAEIVVDDHVRSYTSYIISKMIFGKDFQKGIDLFPKCKKLIQAMGVPTILSGIPLARFIPTKVNKRVWKLEEEIYSMIMDVVKERKDVETNDILQVLIQGARNGELGPSTPEQFIVDNCKDIYLAAYEVTGIAAIWGLMLLAAYPEWQCRVRNEILEVCGDCPLDVDKLHKMKVMKMVIQEVLRLFPGVAFVSRQAMQDLKLGDISVPKDVNIWIWMISLHRDPELWGSDANDFNPERFVNGVSGACKSPLGYIPFGVGSRVCPGQYLAISEMKVLFAQILSKFEFTLSPTYRHCPQFGLLLEPKYGVNVIINKI